MRVTSRVDDNSVQNGFAELYIMLVLKPLLPVCSGYVIPVSPLLFI